MKVFTNHEKGFDPCVHQSAHTLHNFANLRDPHLHKAKAGPTEHMDISVTVSQAISIL